MTNHSWVVEVTVFSIKKYVHKKILKIFSSKQQKFTQSPENIKKYSSK